MVTYSTRTYRKDQALQRKNLAKNLYARRYRRRRLESGDTQVNCNITPATLEVLKSKAARRKGGFPAVVDEALQRGLAALARAEVLEPRPNAAKAES